MRSNKVIELNSFEYCKLFEAICLYSSTLPPEPKHLGPGLQFPCKPFLYIL